MAKLSAIEQRAKILVEYSCVEKISNTEWAVKSQTDPGVKYQVTHEEGGTAPVRGGFCKHIVAVQFQEQGLKIKYKQ